MQVSLFLSYVLFRSVKAITAGISLLPQECFRSVPSSGLSSSQRDFVSGVVTFFPQRPAVLIENYAGLITWGAGLIAQVVLWSMPVSAGLTPSAAGLIEIAAALIPQRTYVVLFYISVKKVTRKTRQGPFVDTYTLECTDLEPSENWTLAGEDPLIYLSEDTEGYNPPRQWSDPFPRVPEPQPEDPGAAPAVPPQPAPTYDLRQPMQMHHLLVDWCKALGEDPCRAYSAQNVQHMLEAIPPRATDCPVCHKTCFNTQRLKSHVRAQHMEKTPFHCQICDRYFADATTLNIHNRRHDDTAPVFTCGTCNKPFLSRSRVKEHEKSHIAGALNLPCQHCQKVIKERKNLLQHEANCPRNPNRAARIQCPYCSRDYQQKKDLGHHVRLKHPSRKDTWQQDLVA